MSESALVRIFRPTAGIGYSSSYRILIDGTEKGDLWPRQATEVSVRPGQHVIQLRQGLVTRSKALEFEAKPGEVIDFACSPLATLLGFTGLHRATANETKTIETFSSPAPVPRQIVLPQDPRDVTDS